MKTNSIIVLAIAALVTFIGCVKDSLESQDGAMLVDMSFTASFNDLSTKTVLLDTDESNLINWCSDDRISVFPSSSNWSTEFKTEDEGESVTFKGQVSQDDMYVAAYPYQSGAYLSYADSKVYMDLPHNQSAKLGSFADDLMISVSRPVEAGGNLAFLNACGVIKFTIPSGIVSVSFGGNNGENLAGRLEIVWSDDGLTSRIENNERSVIVLKNEDNSELEAGTYYMVVAPTVFNYGFKISLTDSDGNVYVKKSSKEQKVDISRMLNLGEIDLGEPVSPPSQLYFVGSETNWGFVPMFSYPLDRFKFRHGFVATQAGEFKFGTQEGSFDNMYVSQYYYSDIYFSDALLITEGHDSKWKFQEDQINKAYKIEFDTTPLAERMVIEEFSGYDGIWLVGDATPAGWSVPTSEDPNPEARMEYDEDTYKYTWTGDLTSGEIKFTLASNQEWYGKWLMAPSAGQEFSQAEDMDMCYVNLDIYPGNDLKWNVKDKGNYTITINALTEKMTVVKNQ